MTEAAAAVFSGRNWLSFQPVIAAALTQCDRLEAEADRPAESTFAALSARYQGCAGLFAGLTQAVDDVRAAHASAITPELRRLLADDMAALQAAFALPPAADATAYGAALDAIWQLTSRVADDLIRLEGGLKS